MPTLRVLTLNILNLADRWPERMPLLLAEFGALQPDIAALQEVVYPMSQDRLLGASGAASYQVRRGWSARPEYGNSLLIRDGAAVEVLTDPDDPEARLPLDLGRAAHRVDLRLATGETLRIANTHLHHLVPDHELRATQCGALLEWLDAAPPVAATLVTGDFNAAPHEPAAALMTEAGYRSAFAEVHGGEHALTWPSGLIATGIDTDGDPRCLDYIWMRGAVRARFARLCFDRPAVDDPTLYPSDHRGVLAEVEVEEG
jgi:endonuclease/exonuclease/phosphatase family metal-dependent hydrolase